MFNKNIKYLPRLIIFDILELIKVLQKELKTDIEPIFGPNRDGDIPHSNANITKAKNMLEYEPKITFEEGIKNLILS